MCPEGWRISHFIAIICSVFAYRGQYRSIIEGTGLVPGRFDPGNLQPIRPPPTKCEYDPKILVTEFSEQGITPAMGALIEDLCRTHLGGYYNRPAILVDVNLDDDVPQPYPDMTELL